MSDLAKIDSTKTNMECVYNLIYDYQESIIESDVDNQLLIGDKLRSKAKELYLSIIGLCTNSKNESLTKTVSIEILFDLILECSGLSPEMFKMNKYRKRELVLARQVHMCFLHITFEISLAKSASIYNKNHATAIHACSTIRDLFQTNKDFRQEYSKVIDHCLNYDISTNSTKTIDFLTKKSTN